MWKIAFWGMQFFWDKEKSYHLLWMLQGLFIGKQQMHFFWLIKSKNISNSTNASVFITSSNRLSSEYIISLNQIRSIINISNKHRCNVLITSCIKSDKLTRWRRNRLKSMKIDINGFYLKTFVTLIFYKNNYIHTYKR